MSWSQHQAKLLGHIFLFINTLFPWSWAKLDAAPHVLLSLRNIWRAHLLQKTRTAGCLQHTGARRPPGVSNKCWKAGQKVQSSGGSICQGHRGQEQQMFLMLLWDLPVLLSLLPSKLLTLLEFQESIAACLWFGQSAFIDLFLQTQLVTSFWSSFPPVTLCQGCCGCQDCLEGAGRSWVSWSPDSFQEDWIHF